MFSVEEDSCQPYVNGRDPLFQLGTYSRLIPPRLAQVGAIRRNGISIIIAISLKIFAQANDTTFEFVDCFDEDVFTNSRAIACDTRLEDIRRNCWMFKDRMATSWTANARLYCKVTEMIRLAERASIDMEEAIVFRFTRFNKTRFREDRFIFRMTDLTFARSFFVEIDLLS